MSTSPDWLNVDQIEAYTAKATKGPWDGVFFEWKPEDQLEIRGRVRSGDRTVFRLVGSLRADDLWFIARARQDVPLLIQRVRQLEEQFGELEGEIEKTQAAVAYCHRLLDQALEER